METIGHAISEFRKRKGLTQEELSNLSKINLRTLQRIEKGKTEPRGDTLNKLCNVLEISIGDVLDYGKTMDLNRKWYDDRILANIIYVVFWPIGLYLIWRNEFIAKWWKNTATAIIPVLFILSLLVGVLIFRVNLGRMNINKRETANLVQKTELIIQTEKIFKQLPAMIELIESNEKDTLNAEHHDKLIRYQSELEQVLLKDKKNFGEKTKNMIDSVLLKKDKFWLIKKDKYHQIFQSMLDDIDIQKEIE